METDYIMSFEREEIARLLREEFDSADRQEQQMTRLLWISDAFFAMHRMSVGELKSRLTTCQLRGLHASAPKNHRCSDCYMIGYACPTCYKVWWETQNPNCRQLP